MRCLMSIGLFVVAFCRDFSRFELFFAGVDPPSRSRNVVPFSRLTASLLTRFPFTFSSNVEEEIGIRCSALM